MTEMAQATFPDGTLPPVEDVMRIAANLFSAGSETTARLIGMCIRTLGDHPEFQQRLRDDRSLIGPFIEEMLRAEAPLKGSFKLSKVRTVVGGVELRAEVIRARSGKQRIGRAGIRRNDIRRRRHRGGAFARHREGLNRGAIRISIKRDERVLRAARAAANTNPGAGEARLNAAKRWRRCRGAGARLRRL